MIKKLHELLEQSFDEMVSIRRYLHQYPELSFKETNTSSYITNFYEQLNIEVQSHVGGNGVVARIHGGKPGKTVALRADFDALPIQDEKDVSYKSTVPGVMHACGHDGHTATLLLLAKAIHSLKDDLAGEYVFIHQHAEEVVPGGAKSMIEAGCLDGVDAIFGTHLWAIAPTGSIQYRVGPIMAAADSFEINILGKGGHGAQPHKTKDSIVAGAQLVTALQQIVSRRINPLDSAVLSIGGFIADNAFNVIADTVKIRGTVRTFKDEIREHITNEMERIIKGTCLSADCDYEFLYYPGYPPVVTHKTETEFVVQAAALVDEVNNIEEIDPEMIGEDFAYYLQNVKGTFFFTGAKPLNGETYGHHHPKFDIDEKAMLVAAKTLGTAAITYHQIDKSDISLEEISNTL